MTSGSDGQQEVTAFHVENLRRRLLDLSNRNPLLNFRHADRSRNHIRVIDELPEFLYSTILEGRPMLFKALPEPSEQVQLRAEVEGVKADEAYVARAEGLDPRFELPEPAPSEQAKQHVDRFIQTRHFQPQMERKLSGIRGASRTSLQEMGVHTLYAAFGFLEWREGRSDSKAQLAPLLLHPLELERKLEGNKYHSLG